MIIGPRHFAAGQFFILSIYLIASWYTLPGSVDSAASQIEQIFSREYQYRIFFLCFALSALVASILALIFWFQFSAKSPYSEALVAFSIAMLAVAFWQFDISIIFGFGLGCIFAAWSWCALNNAFDSGRAKR